MEEGDSKDDLTHEGFPWYQMWILVQHVLEMRSQNREHQHVVFTVHSTHPKLVQRSKDVFGSWVWRTRLGRKVSVDLDLVALAGKCCHYKFEGDISATFERGR
jgi:hypothetical protein